MRVVPALLIGVLLAACGGVRASGPAWPEQAEAESDGGESLAPRDTATAVALEAAKAPAKPEAEPESAPEVDPEDGSADLDDDAAAAEPAAADLDASDDEIVITGEEIVIEIDDDE